MPGLRRLLELLLRRLLELLLRHLGLLLLELGLLLLELLLLLLLVELLLLLELTLLLLPLLLLCPSLCLLLPPKISLPLLPFSSLILLLLFTCRFPFRFPFEFLSSLSLHFTHLRSTGALNLSGAPPGRVTDSNFETKDSVTGAFNEIKVKFFIRPCTVEDIL